MNLVKTIPENLKLRNDYTTLVLSGGGVNGLLQLGFLHSLHVKSFIDFSKIENFIGTSIGSIICLLLLLNIPPIDILSRFAFNNDIINSLKPDIFGVIRGFGIINPIEFFKFIEDVVIERVGFVPTMIQLFKLYKKSLTAVTYNLSGEKKESNGIVYINHISHPDISCIDAVRMSSNIPLVFTKFSYKDDYYIDGAVGDNFPIKYAYDSFHGKILGINIDMDGNKSNKDINILEYCRLFVSISYTITNNSNMNFFSDRTHTVFLSSSKDQDSFSFSLDSNKKFNMFTEGYSSGEYIISNTINTVNSGINYIKKDTKKGGDKEEKID